MKTMDNVSLLVEMVRNLHQKCTNPKSNYHLKKDILKSVIDTYEVSKKIVNNTSQSTISKRTSTVSKGTQIECPITNIATESPASVSDILKELQNTIAGIPKLVQAEVAKITSQQNQSPPINPGIASKESYADVTAKPSLLIASSQATMSTKELFRKEISFKDKTFAPRRVKVVKGNKLRVEFEKESERDLVEQHFSQSTKLQVEKIKTHDPLAIIKGIQKEIAPADLPAILVRQNASIFQKIEEIKIRFTKPNRHHNRYNAVIQIPPTTLKSLNSATRVNIDHDKIRVTEYVPFVMCYRCLAFGHFQRSCKAKQSTCSHCATKSHDRRTCPNINSLPKCHNCTKYSKPSQSDTGILIKAHHTATSFDCPQIKFMAARMKIDTNYGI